MEIIQPGAFRLQVKHEWDKNQKKSLVTLDWGKVPDLSNDGYSIYQSEDQKSWQKRSASYGKAITVLNVYPDRGDTLKEWMDSLNLKDKDGKNLIQVKMVSITNFNADPEKYLKNENQYVCDVVMFGSWDWNNSKDLNDKSANAVKAFMDSGKGVLFGHDTITGSNYNWSIMTPSHVYFNRFEAQLGIELAHQSYYRIGSKKIQVTNNGYLMKYPFELKNNQTLEIPLTHSWGQAIKPNTSVIKWAAFLPPFDFNIQTGKNDGNFYLVTNNNVGLIQTGHSNSQSTMDERKIIANTLYNLAQVTLDTHADDYSVKDDVAPESPTVKVDEQQFPKLKLAIDAVDIGKDYYYYVEAATKKNGILKSDTVKENVCSDIQGYLYTIDQKPTTEPEASRDEYGVVTNLTQKVEDPKTDIELSDFDAIRDSEKWLHVRAVDRANNIGATKHVQIKELLNRYQVTEQFLYSDGENGPVTANKITMVNKNETFVSSFQQLPDMRLLSYQLDEQEPQTVTGQEQLKVEKINDHHTITYRYEPIMTVDFYYLDEETGKSLKEMKRVQLNEAEAKNYLIEKPNFPNMHLMRSTPDWNSSSNLEDKLGFWNATSLKVRHYYHAMQDLFLQVIGEQNNAQIPKKGNAFVTIKIDEQAGRTYGVTAPIEKKGNTTYQKIKFLRNLGDQNLDVQLVLPEFSRYTGYQFKQGEISKDVPGNQPRFSVPIENQFGAIYLTLYLENSSNKQVQRYSWAQKETLNSVIVQGTSIPDP